MAGPKKKNTPHSGPLGSKIEVQPVAHRTFRKRLVNEAKLERFFWSRPKKNHNGSKCLNQKDLNCVSSFGFELKFRSSKKIHGMIYQNSALAHL